MNFTTTLPTVPGFYWVKVKPREDSIWGEHHPGHTIVRVWIPKGVVDFLETRGSTRKLLKDPSFLAWAGPIELLKGEF